MTLPERFELEGKREAGVVSPIIKLEGEIGADAYPIHVNAPPRLIRRDARPLRALPSLGPA